MEDPVLKEIMENIGVMLAYFDLDFNFISVNTAYAKGSGYKPEELIGKNHFTLFPNKENQTIFERVKETGERATFFDKPFEHPNQPERGTTYWNWTLAPVKDENGAMQGLILSLGETTQRKRMEQELKESEEKYRKQFEEAMDAIFLADGKTGIIIDCNRAATELAGRPKSELVGAHQQLLHHVNEHTGGFSTTFEQHLNKRGALESQIVTKNGEIRDVIIKASTFKVGNKKIIQGIFRDITERKRMEKSLRLSEEQHRIMVEQAPDSIMIFDTNGFVTACNSICLSLTGFSMDQLIGKHFLELSIMLNNNLKEFPAMFSKLLEGKQIEPFEVSFFDEHNNQRFGDVHLSIMKRGNKITGFQTIMRDITKRRKAEQALRESEKRFRELSELLPEVVYETDCAGVLNFVNHEVYHKFGYSPKEFEIGINAVCMIAPEDRERAKANLGKILAGQNLGPNEYMAMRKDGTKFPIIVNSSPIVHWNKIVGMRGVMVDITEHMKTEDALKETLANLETLNEKLGVIGKLTRHDARNKLAVIMNHLYLAKRKLAANDVVLEHLEDIELAVGQITSIFDFSRTYEKLGTEQLSFVDVKRIVDEAFQLVSGSKTVKLVNECAGLSVKADSLLRQFFYNLIDDSLKYGEKVTQIKVYYTTEKGCLKLIYEDDGIGILDKEKEKIFKEGYGKGTGYGLYLIKKICDVYGWNIKETGTLGNGAQFTVTIPKSCEKIIT